MDLLAFILALQAEGMTDEQVQEALNAYIAEHPEAVTTVADGSITKAKLDNNLKETVDDVGELKSALNTLENTESDYTVEGSFANLMYETLGLYVDEDGDICQKEEE